MSRPVRAAVPPSTGNAASPGALPEEGQRNAVPAASGQTEEAALVRRAQAGDLDAYEDLVRQHQPRVFGIVGGLLRRREDIEDVAQQVFLKVFVSLRRFALRSSFSTWLYKVTVNECFDYLRKKKVRPLIYEADMSEEQVAQLECLERETGGGAGDDPAQRAELRELVDRLLEELSEEERLMMVLKEVEGLTVEEIGKTLGMNVNTVKVRLFRTRARLVDIYRKRLAAARAGHRKKGKR